MSDIVGVDLQFSTYCAQLQKKFLRNRKVLLVQSPQFLMDTFNPEIARVRGYYAFPPAGLQWIAKEFLRCGFDLRIVDLNYEILRRTVQGTFDLKDWPLIIDECLTQFREPSIVGVTCLSVGVDILSDRHPLTAILRYFKKKGESLVITGGPTATNEYQTLLQKGLCHFVVEGEGENKIKCIIDELSGTSTVGKRMPGVYFFSDGKLSQTTGQRDVVMLKGNLIDTYAHIPIQDYCRVGSLNPFSRMAGIDIRFAGIQLNRGCRGDCQFCGVTDFMGKGVRQFPAQDVIEEIRYLVNTEGVRHFEILDDDFLGGPEQQPALKRLLQEMVVLHKEHATSWAAANGLIVASITEELFDLMRDSGCVGFRLGIESGSEQLLKKLHKPASLGKIREVARLLQNYPQMFAGGNFIIGLLGEETFGDMLKTFFFALELNLDWMAVTTFQLTSKANAERKKLSGDGSAATDFIPAKDTKSGEIDASDEGEFTGMNIFNFPPDRIPGRHEIKNIWFAFNLLANYVFNKNLKPGGNVRKFVSWVDAINAGYPDNAYMPLFSGIGNVLLGNTDRARVLLRQTRKIISGSAYWRDRFDQFSLTELVDHFPGDRDEVFTALEELQATIKVKIPFGEQT